MIPQKKTIFFLFLLFSIHCLLAVAQETELFVSTAGDDSWSGTLAEPNATLNDGPFATVEKARDAVRTMKETSGLTKPVTIQLRGGTYELNQPLVFAPQDSGTETFPITYEAFPGETPILSGGRQITGWQEDGNGRFVADVPRINTGRWSFSQLFVNCERRQRARTPNTGYLRAERTLPKGLIYKEGDIKQWENYQFAMLTVFNLWVSSYHYIDRLDEEERYVEVSTPDIPWNGFGPPWEANQRYYVENILEALDEPGEWYLDRNTEMLTYYPMPGEATETINVIAPVLSVTLLNFQGEPEQQQYIEHLIFKGLSFQHTKAYLPRSGVGATQSAVYQNAAIMTKGLRNSKFEQCEVAHVGEHGIWLHTGSKNNEYNQCHIHDLGAGGIMIGDLTAPARKYLEVGNITVDNCFIHDGGHFFQEGPGLLIGHSSNNNITHNDIRDFNHIGISIGWQWNYNPTTAHDNIIEYNHVYEIGHRVFSDMGAVYTLGVSPGTRIRYNRIHDVKPSPKYYNGHLTSGLGYAPLEGSGIYTDEGSSQILIENNIVYNIDGVCYFMNYGQDNIVHNNIFAQSLYGVGINAPDPYHTMFDLKQNIISTSTPHILMGHWNAKTTVDSNLYWTTSEQTPDFGGSTFTQWQTTHSNALLADPAFVDAANGDFNLKPDSPATQTGFQPIDSSQIGLYGDAQWTALPHNLPIREDQPEAPPRMPEEVDDDFERTTLGRAPFRTINYQPGPSQIIVTNEKAATGNNSVKFVDAPGLDHSFNPHMYYEPNFHDGQVILEFDFYNSINTPAAIHIEARDWTQSQLQSGVAFDFTSAGALTASGVTLAQIPKGSWIHVKAIFETGNERGQTYELELSSAEEDKQTFTLNYVSSLFKALTWFGISATADEAGVCYIDNLELNLITTNNDAPAWIVR